jgi:glycosyltransferase involved in cell wall biosynthesis
MPSVSICIPTYNHAKFLKDALCSAVAQTYLDLDILVLDNASQDDTESVVAEFASKDSRIRYIRHPTNIGIIGNLDACIEHAQGKYIKILCADDRLEPECVSAMAAILEKHSTVSLVGCARTITDVHLLPLRVAKVRGNHECVPGQEMIAECFYLGNRIGEPTAVMFRRSEAMRGFCGNYPHLVDMEMWFHLLSKGDFYALPEALCITRSHAGQATWVNDQDGRIVEDRRRLYLDFGDSAGRSAGLFRQCIWDFRMAYAVVRSKSAGWRGINNAMREVYFPRLFPRFTYPMVRLLMALGLGLIWRTSP